MAALNLLGLQCLLLGPGRFLMILVHCDCDIVKLWHDLKSKEQGHICGEEQDACLLYPILFWKLANLQLGIGYVAVSG